MIKWLGIGLIVISSVLYGSILAIPFLSLTLKAKAAVTTALIITGEATFWIGALILGKEVVTCFRRHLNPRNWFAKKNKPDIENEI
jgi:hypothetical protein